MRRRLLLALVVLLATAPLSGQSRLLRIVGVPPEAGSCGALPMGWVSQDIGSGQVAGSACYDSGTAQFTINGAGLRYTSADQGHFANLAKTGNWEIVYRLVAIDAPGVGDADQTCGAWAQQSSAAGAKKIQLDIDGNGTAFMASRLTLNGAVSGTIGSGATWGRLRIISGNGQAAQSVDGVVWTDVGTLQAIGLSGSYLLGLGCGTFPDTGLATAVFADVTVTEIIIPDDEEDCGGYRPQLCTLYGMNTQAGRGGALIFMNTLADNATTPASCTGNCGGLAMTAVCDTITCYTASFRMALSWARPGCNGGAATCARTVVFTTSGTIVTTLGGITISSPYLTIAGQTAPSPGITVRHSATPVPPSGSGISVATHDVIVQHVRLRGGSLGCNDQLIAYGGSEYNVVADHVSIGWAQDDSFTAYNSSTSVTLWRSIVAESLNNAQPGNTCTGGGSDGHGVLAFADATNVLIAQNLIMSHNSRCPYVQGGTATVVVNNLVYNCRGGWAFFVATNYNANGGLPGSRWLATVVGNRVVRGPSTGDCNMWEFSAQGSTPVAANRIYRTDNTWSGTVCNVVEFNDLGYSPDIGTPDLVLPTGYVALASTAVEAFVVANAGARPLDRDSVDTRYIAELGARTGSASPASQADVGGWPTLAVNTHVLPVPASPHSIATGQTVRTNLEMWLETCALQWEIGGANDCVP